MFLWATASTERPRAPSLDWYYCDEDNSRQTASSSGPLSPVSEYATFVQFAVNVMDIK